MTATAPDALCHVTGSSSHQLEAADLPLPAVWLAMTSQSCHRHQVHPRCRPRCRPRRRRCCRLPSDACATCIRPHHCNTCVGRHRRPPQSLRTSCTFYESGSVRRQRLSLGRGANGMWRRQAALEPTAGNPQLKPYCTHDTPWDASGNSAAPRVLTPTWQLSMHAMSSRVHA